VIKVSAGGGARRRRRTGDAFRGHDYSGKKWREHDMPLLGWRYREPYATKSTFITLVIEDGARREARRHPRSRDAHQGGARRVQRLRPRAALDRRASR